MTSTATEKPERCIWCHATEGLHRVEYPPCTTVIECVDKATCNERWLEMSKS